MNKQLWMIAVLVSGLLVLGGYLFLNKDNRSQALDTDEWVIAQEESVAEEEIMVKESSIIEPEVFETVIAQENLMTESVVAFEKDDEVVEEVLIQETSETATLDFPIYSMKIPSEWMLVDSTDREGATWFWYESSDFHSASKEDPIRDLRGFIFKAFSEVRSAELIEKGTTSEEAAQQSAQMTINWAKLSSRTYENSYVKIDRDDKAAFTVWTMCSIEPSVCDSSATGIYQGRTIVVYMDYENTDENRRIGNSILESIVLK